MFIGNHKNFITYTLLNSIVVSDFAVMPNNANSIFYLILKLSYDVHFKHKFEIA